MVKKIDPTQPTSPEKEKEKDPYPLKGKKPCTKDHLDQYRKKYEKAYKPRRVWPTDSERHKKKGPKI